MTGPRVELTDQAQRDRIRTDFEATLFVEAAAGTGKTTALVQRLVGMIASGIVAIDEVAAITFTEKAAAELRDRVRHELSDTVARGGTEGGGERCQRALDQLDDATICTLHAFAQRILSEFALEVGLPPRFEVLDEIESAADFDAVWERFVSRLLGEPGDDVRQAFAMGLRLGDLRDLASTFREHWDRLEDLDIPTISAPPVDLDPIVHPLTRAFDALATACTDPADKLSLHLEEIAPWFRRLQATDDPDDQLVAVAEAPALKKGRGGQQGNWGGKATIEAVRGDLSDAEAACTRLVDGTRGALVASIARDIADFTLDEAERRRSEGRLEFHDLLVLARRLLRSDASVRATLRSRWPRLLIDEFQDTDPLQIEIATLLATERDEVGDDDWWDLPLRPGSLFLVGDPKQSIYRFRRADIAVWERASTHFAEGHVTLVSNFRCSEPVVSAVNAVFERMMGGGLPGLQAPYSPLSGVRTTPAPGVHVIGDAAAAPAGLVREVEAAELAELIETAKADGWWVHDRGDLDDPGRPLQFGDVAILLPTRRSLPLIERSLAARGIPYRIESRSLLWSTQEVRDLLAILRALDDPGDQLALTAALRSAAFGCSDADLLEFVAAGGRWDHTDPGDHGLPADHPVVEGLGLLAEWHRQRHWQPLPAIVEEVIRRGHLVEVQAAKGRPRDHRRRLRFVADQARALAESGRATIREFVDWADRQADQQAMVNESVVPEDDDDAVRIMTVHAAKGLEFPVVALAGLGTEAPFRRPPALFDHDGIHLFLGTNARAFATPGYDAVHQREREAELHEQDRLLYVATTRARDHLIVSLHHKEGQRRCHAARLEDAVDDPEQLASVAAPPAAPPMDPPPVRTIDVPGRDEFVARHEATVAALRRRDSVAATAVADDDDGRDPKAEPPDVPAWKRGRAGTSVGRAVHAALQTIDLESGDGLTDAARAQAAAEGVSDRIDDVERMCRAALQSEAVRAAVASGRFWREVYVAAPVDGITVEGFIDLLYEDGDSLVVVDYKTDQVDDGEDDVIGPRYRLQGAAYAAVIEAALGRRVSRCTFVFVGARRAVERDIADLPAAIAEVTDRVGGLAGPRPGS